MQLHAQLNITKAPQSQATDQPMAPRGRGIRKQTNKTTEMKAIIQLVITKLEIREDVYHNKPGLEAILFFMLNST